MSHRVSPLIPVITYVLDFLTHLIPVIRYVLKSLIYVMLVIRYVVSNKTSYSSYKVWSEAAVIRNACHKVCRIGKPTLCLS